MLCWEKYGVIAKTEKKPNAFSVRNTSCPLMQSRLQMPTSCWCYILTSVDVVVVVVVVVAAVVLIVAKCQVFIVGRLLANHPVVSARVRPSNPLKLRGVGFGDASGRSSFR